MSNESLVSVVIPAYNCANTISDTIKALLAQTYPNIEIIIVDDGSTDSTAQIIKSFPKISYIFQANSGPATARNCGSKVARGDFIFFTDSDCIPHKNWIETGVKAFHFQKVAVVAGSYGIANSKDILARCIHNEILYRHHNLMPQNPKAFGSYNFGVKRNVFEEVGGFNEDYSSASGEDNDLSYKIVKKEHDIYFERDSLVDHFHTTKIWKYLKEQYRHGKWRVKMYFDHPSMIKGDDYTFWKDIIEIPLSVLIVLSFLFFLKTPAILLISFLIGIELFFSFKLSKNICECIYYAFVMFLRSFARAFGFSSGFVSILLVKYIKNNK